MNTDFVDRGAAKSDYVPAKTPAQPKPEPTLKCKQCDGTMVHWQKSSGNALGLVLALFFFVVGLGLTFTIVGAIVGVPMMIAALFIGGKKEKFWRCQNCGSVIPRA